MQLTEKYRPRTYAEVIAQPKAVGILQRLDLRGKSVWLQGQSGVGKTSLAKIMADSVADRLYQTEIVARKLTFDTLKTWFDDTMKTTLFGSGGFALIVNEAHGLSKPVIELFLDVLENLRDNSVVIFTTTKEGADLFEEKVDYSPFKSRCITIQLAQRDLCKPFAARLKEIATIENLDGRPITDYETLVKDCRNNFREALNRIAAGAMLNQ
jgi:replication-associated recombination protein RarA